MLRVLHAIKRLFMNSIVTYIPCWPIRYGLFRLAGMHIGKGSRIMMGTRFEGPLSNIHIGEHSYINSHCHLDGRGGLLIGNNVNISNYCKVVSASHDMHSETFAYREGSVRIEDYCWLGTASIVLDRSILQAGMVLGAGSVFKGVGEPDFVYIGVPAKKTKRRKLAGPYDIEYKPLFL